MLVPVDVVIGTDVAFANVPLESDVVSTCLVELLRVVTVTFDLTVEDVESEVAKDNEAVSVAEGGQYSLALLGPLTYL